MQDLDYKLGVFLQNDDVGKGGFGDVIFSLTGRRLGKGLLFWTK